MQRNALPIMAELAKDEERSGEQGGPQSRREKNRQLLHVKESRTVSDLFL